MAIAVDGFTVVVLQSALEPLGGVDWLAQRTPNRTFCHDEMLARCSFMDRADAVDFINQLVQDGLQTDPVRPTVVLVNAFDAEMRPECDWLQVAPYAAQHIAWHVDTEPKTISAPQGWDPQQSASLEHWTHEEAAKRLKFVRREDNIEVFVDTETGRELYVGRTGLPLTAMFEEARDFVFENLRQFGEPPAKPELHDELHRVIQMLQVFSEQRPDAWASHWLIGKAQHALDDIGAAADAMSAARKLAPDNVDVLRELGGLCLEANRFAEAVSATESAVAQVPDDAELLSNLALSYLLDGRVDEAKRSIQRSQDLQGDDPVASAVAQLIDDVAAGRRPAPKSLAEL